MMDARYGHDCLVGLVMALNASASRSAEVILSAWASVIITGVSTMRWQNGATLYCKSNSTDSIVFQCS